MPETSSPGAAGRIVLQGGAMLDGGTNVPQPADVVLVNNLIHSVGGPGTVEALPGDLMVDCTGRILMPGFVDAHSHADAKVFEARTQLALLRQGITTVIGGQDGVSFAPGSGKYATSYFAAINGPHPHYSGGGVADLLACHDKATPLNFAYLVPAGTVRWEVMGRRTGEPSAAQMTRMQVLVAQGMAAGAVGLSTGLDYVPGIFASDREIAELCIPVAQVDSVYVTHMRGGYEANSSEGVEEIIRICTASGVKAHISHFHATAPIIESMLDELAADGVDATFDAYPYTRGCTLLSMPLLPPELSLQPVESILAALSSPADRLRIITEWFPVVAQKPSLGPDWPTMITLGHIAAEDYQWAHGLNLAQAAERAHQDVPEFVLDLLLASHLEVNAIMAVRYSRDMAELGRIMSNPAHLGGSDGIFIGAHPHPRAAGSFAKYLHCFVRELQVWTWAQAVQHLSTRTCERFSLGRRGRIEPGWVADIVLVDPFKVSDSNSYEEPLALAVGIADVFVAGVQVLADGKLTGATPGRAILRHPPIH